MTAAEQRQQQQSKGACTMADVVEPAPPPPRSYPVKWVDDEFGKSTPIALQGSNGPCALLALLNVQFQRGTIKLAPNSPKLDEATAMSMLADLASRGAARLSNAPEVQLQRESAVQHFVELLPSLARGMHVNVRFSSPTAFEFTKEIAAFDCFPDVQLVHGWLVDPQDEALASAFGSMSYNQIMDELVKLNDAVEPLPESTASSPGAAIPSAPPPPDEDDELEMMLNVPPTRSPSTTESGIIDIALPSHLMPARKRPQIPDYIPSLPPSPEESSSTSLSQETDDDEIEPAAPSALTGYAPQVWEFLDLNPTMLTHHGILEVAAALGEDESAILFRNSHFYVVRKRGGRLFTLVSDQGFALEPTVVWELLRDINGDSDFYDAAFVPASASSAGKPPPQPSGNAASASSGNPSQRPNGSPVTPPARPPAQSGRSQSGRHRRAAAAAAAGGSAAGGSGGRRNSKRDEHCCLQ